MEEKNAADILVNSHLNTQYSLLKAHFSHPKS